MQKKIIALAVAGLASTAAFAQSNVTVYGVMDLGYQYTSSSDTSSLKSRSGIDSGMLNGSRIGFRGVEDLGNGLKVSFVQENSVGADVGSGPSMTRQSLLALSGNFGTIAAGRQYTPQYGLVSKVDPFGAGTVGDVTYGRGLYTMATGMMIDGAAATGDDIRLNNLVAYVSPNFSGFNVIAGYTANGLADEESTPKGAKSTNAKVWAINPNYSNGPLFVGLNYHKVSIDGFGRSGADFLCTAAVPTPTCVAVAANAGTDVESRAWDLGGTYDFGVAKLHALYGQNKDDVGTLNNKDKKWMLGVSAPVGNFNVMASYTRLKSDGDAFNNGKANKWALGTTYSLSKRTVAYATYAKISTNNQLEGFVGVQSGTDYTSGLNIGLRHNF